MAMTGLVSAGLTSCHKDEATLPVRHTVLVYMVAQNSLGYRSNSHLSYAQADSAEMVKGLPYIPEDGRILMYIDDNELPRLYELTHHTSTPRLVRRWTSDVCSASPETFGEVLSYVKSAFPSDDYGLVMWSHADGWLPSTDTTYTRYASPLSFGIDSGPGSHMSNKGAQMNVGDMARTISETGMHFRFMFFDACLMQNLEVAYALRHATDYVIAAPIATPGAGSDYTNDIRYGFFSSDPSDIARTYLRDVQDPSYDDPGFGLSISSIRTDRLQALADALKEALPHSSLMGRQSPDFSNVLNYQAYLAQYYFRPHNYDARQALRTILPEEYFQRVNEALNEAVAFHGATDRFWIGPGMWSMQSMPVETDDYRSVSLFVPQTVYTTNAPFSVHGDLNEAFRSTEWYRAAGWDVTGW